MRRMTLSIFALSLILVNPAYAQDDRPKTEVIEQFNDPAFQDNMVSMMSGFMAALMDLPIGQFAGAMDKAIPDEMRRDSGLSHIEPDTTLGDFARRDDPDFDHNAEEKMRRGTAMMGIIASEFGALLPQLQAIGERMKRQMETAQ